MVKVEELSPETLALAQAIGSWGIPMGLGFVLGVYRHLLNWPGYMAYVGSILWLRLENSEIKEAGTVMSMAARSKADALVAKLLNLVETIQYRALGFRWNY